MNEDEQHQFADADRNPAIAYELGRTDGLVACREQIIAIVQAVYQDAEAQDKIDIPIWQGACSEILRRIKEAR